MTGDETHLDRLASAVADRRLYLGLTQHQAASLAGVSDTTWGQVENGRHVGQRTLALVSRAMWNDAHAWQTILEGGDPPDNAATPPLDTSLLAAVRELTEVVRELRADLGRR